jgi:hypothetical protein
MVIWKVMVRAAGSALLPAIVARRCRATPGRGRGLMGDGVRWSRLLSGVTVMTDLLHLW